MNNNGLVIWEGESLIDGSSIVLLMTGLIYSTNRKTGNQLQTWIMRSDIHPIEAVKTGDDESICGSCSRRGQGKNTDTGIRTCYVAVHQSPTQVWRTYKNNDYARYNESYNPFLNRRSLRMGSYGDPAAVPIEVWKNLIDVTYGHTGFTSQWRDEYAKPLKGLVQASCNSVEDMELAKSMGWKTYTSLPVGHPKVKGLLECRFKSSDGTIKCEQCMLCDGTKSHIMIEDHGIRFKQRIYRS